MFGEIKIYYQKIFYGNGDLYGIELLTRGIKIDEKTDLLILNSVFSLLKEKWFIETVNQQGLYVHFNVFPSSIEYVNWEKFLAEFSPLKERLVLEILETDVYCYTEQVKRLADKGINLALDDFGTGTANFSALSELFKVVKIDGEAIKGDVSLIAEFLKRGYQIDTIIVEKKFVRSLLIDGYQCFQLHKPEPIENLIRERQVEKENSQPVSLDTP